MKKVIFIGGTAFSGSTMLCLALANDEQGFAVGEVRHLFCPQTRYHKNYEEKCGCEDKKCRVWHQVKSAGIQNLYSKIFEMFPNVSFIVDSSKDPFWIEQQSKILEKQGIEVKHLLVWKSPLEFAYSCLKRNQNESQWSKSWVSYHRLYHSLVGNWRSVSYSQYVANDELLEKVCNSMDIPYYEDKALYWQKQHHVLGGNPSARIHLYDKQSTAYRTYETRLPKEDKARLERDYKNIRAKDIENEEVRKLVTGIINTSDYFDGIQKMLENKGFGVRTNVDEEYAGLKLSSTNIAMRWVKRRIRLQIGRSKYG